MALPSLGQLDTNAWPAYLHPRKGAIQAENCSSAIVERAATFTYGDSAYLPSLSFFRTQRGNCINVKYKLASVIAFGYWTCPTNTIDSIQAFMNSQTTEPRGGTVLDALAYSNRLTAVTLLAYLKLPTNYFSYTPYRGLDGVGPNTNDEAVIGHPHGWTNAFTVLGGTNFPYGRTCWYTTDYGWDSALLIITNLTKRFVGVSGAFWNDTYGMYSRWANYSSNSWSEAQSLAEASLTNGTAGFAWGAWKLNLSGEFNQYYYRIRMPIMNYAYSWYTNGPEPDVSALFRTWTVWQTWNGTENFSYDGDQLGFTKYGAWYIASTNVEQVYGWQIAVASNTSPGTAIAYIGTTNSIPLPPASPPQDYQYFRGVGLRYSDAWVGSENAYMLLDYEKSNGFKYK